MNLPLNRAMRELAPPLLTSHYDLITHSGNTLWKYRRAYLTMLRGPIV